MVEAIADIAEPDQVITDRDMDWIALAGPQIAEPLAVWLESWDGVSLSEHHAMPEDYAHALAVARALTGGAR